MAPSDPAPAAQDQGVEAAPGGREGIQNARARGIDVDPAVEELMAQAPAGSCANDPTLPTCPPAHAVVRSDDFFHVDPKHRIDLNTLRPPKVLRAPAAKVSKRVQRLRAKAAQAVYGCYVKVTAASPYYASGYAQMNANNYCVAGVSDVDVYIELQKFYVDRWYRMNGRWQYPTIPQNYYSWHLTYNCEASVNRYWIARATGYALAGGVWYAGSYTGGPHLLPCG